MSFNPFGGLFDFDGDGKTDAFEMALGFAIMDDMERQSSRSGSGLFSGSYEDDEDDDEDDDEKSDGLGISYGSSFGREHSYDDHDMDLDLAGLDRFDLELMDEDERRQTLEDAGLDPDDYDF